MNNIFKDITISQETIDEVAFFSKTNPITGKPYN